MKSSDYTKEQLMEMWSEEIQRAGTLTVLHTNAVSQRVGLSATEFEAIDVITRNQPITAGKLAVFCGLTTGAITGLVDRLVGAGYIKRKNDPNDRRKVLLMPIENGMRNKKIRRLYMPIAQGYEKVASAYSKDELVLLIDAQTKLNDMADGVIRGFHEQK